jgi:hypothetical protein
MGREGFTSRSRDAEMAPLTYPEKGCLRDREVTRRIRFPKQMKRVPQLWVCLSHLDVSGKTNMRVRTFADEVTRDGFTLHAATWADSSIYAVSVTWVASADDKVRHENDHKRGRSSTVLELVLHLMIFCGSTWAGAGRQRLSLAQGSALLPAHHQGPTVHIGRYATAI